MKSFFFLMLMTLVSCSHVQKQPDKSQFGYESIVATNWFQTAGEARALYLQGYNFARLSFSESLSKKSQKPRAVVVDIDETILDNSPYQAKVIEERATYPEYWKEWINSEKANALPGALDFLNFVVSKGGTVFYITNRKEDEKQATYNNLKKIGFPIKNESQLLVKVDNGNKTDRRSSVSKTYNIVLLIGDNLNDFDGIFENKSVAEKNELVDGMKESFGTKFIILPNPLYGDWEGALYNYDFKLSNQEKHNRRMKALRSF